MDKPDGTLVHLRGLPRLIRTEIDDKGEHWLLYSHSLGMGMKFTLRRHRVNRVRHHRFGRTSTETFDVYDDLATALRFASEEWEAQVGAT